MKSIQPIGSLKKLSLENDISKALVSGDFEVAKELQEAMKVFEQAGTSDTPAPAMSWQQLMEIGHDKEQDADLRKMFKKQEREDGEIGHQQDPSCLLLSFIFKLVHVLFLTRRSGSGPARSERVWSPSQV